MSSTRASDPPPQLGILRTQVAGNLGDSEVVPSSLVEIAPIFRVAKQVDALELLVFLSAQLTKAYQTAGVLFEVLMANNQTEAVLEEILEAEKAVAD